jgi:hypothetical protein
MDPLSLYCICLYQLLSRLYEKTNPHALESGPKLLYYMDSVGRLSSHKMSIL